MPQSVARQGCEFCSRQGVPILPVRPAIISQHDKLPIMPNHLQIPVNTQGETAYTLRLLRPGFLNIWDEQIHSWINYYVTEEGFYYPLSEDGDAPDAIVSGTLKPCINKPEELAKASLITLPVLPAPMKNSVFWFAWSEVKWTDKVRKRFEDASFREQHMQRFDLEKWLTHQQESQALPLDSLDKTIAEYSPYAYSSQLFSWAMSFKKIIKLTTRYRPALMSITSALKRENKIQQDLHPNGAILVLQDPTAILKDIPSLIQSELDLNIYKNPDIEREIMLYSAITSLKEGMGSAFEHDYIDITMRRDAYIRSIDFNPEGDPTYRIPINTPDSEYMLRRKLKLKEEKHAYWTKYEQYYDTEQVNRFGEKFRQLLDEYHVRVVEPRVQLYLAWYCSPVLTNYFIHHFDSDDFVSGISYTMTINYCVANMIDKNSVANFLSQSWVSSLTDPHNILGRGLAFNHDKFINKIHEVATQSTDLLALPWFSLIDAVKEVIDKANPEATSIMGIYIATLSGVIIRTTNSLLGSTKVIEMMVALGIFQNKSIIRIQKSGPYKHFVKFVVSALMEISNEGVKPNKDALERAVNIELKRLEAHGFPIYAEKKQTYYICLDPQDTEHINQLPKKQKQDALSKLLFSSSEREVQYQKQWRTRLTNGTGKTATLVGAGILSGIFQTIAVMASADFGNKKTLTADQLEENSRFVAGTAGVFSAFFGSVEVGIKGLIESSSLMSARTLRFANIAKVISAVASKGLGVTAGFVIAAFDFYHAWMELQKNKLSIASAYLASGASGIWLAVALIGPKLAVFGIMITILAIFVIFGAAIYIAIESQDKIQKWLEKCLWRKVPGEVPINMWPPIYLTGQMEMDDLKLALGNA